MLRQLNQLNPMPFLTNKARPSTPSNLSTQSTLSNGVQVLECFGQVLETSYPSDVEFVHLLWCDGAGLRRTRIVTIRQFARIIGEGIGLTEVSQLPYLVLLAQLLC